MAMQLSEAHKAAIVASALDCIISIDDQGRITDFNPAAEATFGYHRADVLGRELAEAIIPTGLREAHRTGLAHYLATGEGPVLNQRIEVTAIRSSGEEFPVELAIVPMQTSGRAAFTGFLRDITARNAADSALTAAEMKYRTLVEQIPAVVYVDQRDVDGVTTFVSPRIDELLGYTAAEYLADPGLWARSLHDADRERVLAEAARTRDTGQPFQLEYRLHARDGREVWVRDEAMAADFSSGHGCTWQGILLDISERKRLEERLVHQAFHDSLTGLPNRALLLDRLDHALVRAARLRTHVAILFLDIDRFKTINDSLGHAAGDDVLIELGCRLRRAVREGDTVARISGDEFICVLEDLAEEEADEEALAVADRITGGLSDLVETTHGHVAVTVSIGLVVSGTPVECSDKLLQRADQAMYSAKRSSSGHTAAAELTLPDRVAEYVALERDLRHALERGELRLHYQPCLDVSTGELSNVEALIRWFHPTRGIVAPSVFIPIAEESELIVEIGRWVMQTACEQVASWRREARSLGCPVSVNVSARQIDSPSIVQDVAHILSESGLSPSMLTLGLTERVALSQEQRTVSTLVQLKRIGVRLSIDDFGTGYSGLSMLKQSPVDALKIDRAFVTGLGHDVRDNAIVRTIVALADTLGLETTAEGVETAEQLSILRGLGCRNAQGYLISRPIPLEKLQASIDSIEGSQRSSRCPVGPQPPTRPLNRGRSGRSLWDEGADSWFEEKLQSR